ncbi:MAG: thioredoxin domain-containing protein [Pseudomonadota bacterium]
MKSLSAALLGVALTCLAAAVPAQAQNLSDPESAFKGNERTKTWHAEVERTERGHLIGNPDADAALIEFVSYTCSHCASFAREGEGALDLAVLAPGLMSVEVRPVIRNGLDLAVSLLVQCGDPSGFKARHRMFLFSQDTWLTKASSAPQSQRAMWARGDRNARLNAARALDLDDMLANRGMSLPDINACLLDDAAAKELVDNAHADASEFGVPGTPSFALDGELLADVHSWDALYPVLEERFRPKRGNS